MTQKGRSPLSKLALSQFNHSFGDLLSIRAVMSFFDRTLLEAIFEMIMWFGRPASDYVNFERSARAAYHFLEKGNQIKPKDIALRFYLVIDKVTPALNKSILARKEAERVPECDADTRIKKYLEYYKVMYEGLLPFICAPIIYAFGISKHIKDKAFIPGNDGKVDLKAINKMEKWLDYPENRLSIGLNSHVRNAFAHENYEILDNAQVSLWDKNPYKPQKSWGPEIWRLDTLVELCDQLWVNALGIICALVLYNVNNRQIIEDRGWMPPLQRHQLRGDELKNAIDVIADELGFHLKTMDLLPNGVCMILSVKSKGIDQEAELTLGGTTTIQLFKIPLWYEEKRVIDQCVIMLYRLMPYFDVRNEVSIRVMSLDSIPLGTLITDFYTFSSLQLASLKPEAIESIRHAFKVDTLKECVTFVEKEGIPRYIGTRPMKPSKP